MILQVSLQISLCSHGQLRLLAGSLSVHLRTVQPAKNTVSAGEVAAVQDSHDELVMEMRIPFTALDIETSLFPGSDGPGL